MTVAIAVACSDGPARRSVTAPRSPATSVPATSAPAGSVPGPAPVTVVAAGDIATSENGDTRTADVVAGLSPDVVLTLGDNAYNDGSPEQFARYFEPTWGRFKDKTKPAPGNHEYRTAGARGYFDYFGVDPFYSFDVGGWHLVSLNSEIAHGPGSDQLSWLERDLAGHRDDCVLAYWHRPRYSSGPHGSAKDMAAMWDTVAAGGGDVVLAGHDHDYERFALRDGVRSFVVGTGGAPRYPITTTESGSESHDTTTFGVLELTLRPGSYEWRFRPVAGGAFTGRGTDRCGGPRR